VEGRASSFPATDLKRPSWPLLEKRLGDRRLFMANLSRVLLGSCSIGSWSITNWSVPIPFSRTPRFVDQWWASRLRRQPSLRAGLALRGSFGHVVCAQQWPWETQPRKLYLVFPGSLSFVSVGGARVVGSLMFESSPLSIRLHVCDRVTSSLTLEAACISSL
jgi:hypothetical protein